MALKIWLPLNGNLENKGISDGTVAFVGSPTVNNTGKIGKCYTLNGSNGFSINQQILPSQTPAWSFACWFLLTNITSTAAACLFSERTGGNANGYTIFIYPNNSKMLVDDGVRWTVTPMTFSANTWYHLAVTRDSSGKKIYINGELKSSTTTIGNTSAVNTNGCLIGLAQSSSALATGNQGLIGDINDVRIYDHCLSAKEVKEISQGLVLHYKLDGSINKNWLSDNGEKKIIRSSGNTFVDYNYYSDLTICTDTSYTVNFYARGSVEGMQLDVYFRNASGSAYALTAKQTLTTTWTYYSLPLTGSPADLQIFRARCYAGTAGDIIYIRNMQLLSNNVPIKNEIKDSSGYENNGTIIGTLLTQQDTPRYELSTAFSASSAINCGRNAMVTDSITVNLWAKYSTFSNLMSCTESGGWNFENSSGLTFPVYVNSVGYVHIDAASRPPVANYANAWHMFTGVYDRLNQLVKLYIDGELIGTGAVSAPNPIRYHATNCIWINAEATGSNTAASYGNAKLISDVRIYATALSAKDILDLYHTPANIDNLGGIHGFEMIEDTSSRELLALPWTSSYGTHNKTSISTNYNDKKEWYSNISSSSAGSDYIKINPTGKTYYYDTEISVAAGNQFYIGFERYDENKTSRSNNACVYIVSIKPTSDITHQRYFGTVNLATDGVNPTDTIALRILNAWSGTTSGSTKEATIHYLSLREVSGKPQTEKIKQQGQVCTDEFVEREKQASIYENGFVGGNIIIEK